MHVYLRISTWLSYPDVKCDGRKTFHALIMGRGSDSRIMVHRFIALAIIP